MTPQLRVAAAICSFALLVPVASTASETHPGARQFAPDPAPTLKSGKTETPKDFGPNGPFYSNVDSHSMVPRSDAMLYSRSGSDGFLCLAGSTEKTAYGQIHLPHGVTADFLRVWMYDSSAGEDMLVTLEESCLPDFSAGFPTNTTLASVASSGNPGVFSDSTNFTDRRIDNTSCTYRIRARFGSAAGNCSQEFVFYKARIEWDRIAPPAPLAATFSDVPTTAQFFREIEALADSGITAGCGGGLFCPDVAVTRRQMAAFLVRAFGLQPSFFPDPANP